MYRAGRNRGSVPWTGHEAAVGDSAIRKKTISNAQKPASAKFDVKAVGAWSRKHALELRIDPEWLRIKKTYSIPEIIEMVQAVESKRRKGRPISTKTLAWIERIRVEKRLGRGYLRLAMEFRPDLSKELARAALRKFRSRWSLQIDS